MKKYSLATSVGAGLAIATFLAGYPAQAQERERPRQEQAKREYHFRAQDQSRLRENYRSSFRERDHVDVAHRPHFTVGGRLPGDWRARIHPVPEAVYREFPTIPAGLEIGYLDGYAVVYDPATMEIVEVLDVMPQ